MAHRSSGKLDSFGTTSTNRIRPGTSASCPTHLLAILHAFLPPQIAFQREDQGPHESRSSGMNWKRTLSSTVGLTTPESAERLSTYGSNELEGRGLKSAWLIVWEQLTSLMMLILLAAAAVSIFLGDYSDSIAIGAILALNVLLGFAQEYRAEKARNKSCRVPEKCRSLPNESGCLRSREFPPIFPCYPW
jgi:magnesium-transporting ATPase (P-type)